MFVVDTHALLWHLTEDEKLGEKAKEVLAKGDRGEVIVVIPTIVLAESLFILEKKKVDLEFKDIIRKIEKSLNYVVYPLYLQTVLACNELKEIPEMHDRIIIATAKALDAEIITKDDEITKFKEVKVIW